MKFRQTELPGVVIVEPDVFRDARGFFLETFRADRYREGGIPFSFVQDNHSRSVRRTLRGLHAQRTRPQGKLVRVVRGEIFDIAVVIRNGGVTVNGSPATANLAPNGNISFNANGSVGSCTYTGVMTASGGGGTVHCQEPGVYIADGTWTLTRTGP